MLCAIGTKSIQPMRNWFMSETSPLHCRVRKNTENKVFIQSKFTVDDEGWSTAFFPWTADASQPGDKPWEDKTSGLATTDTTMAPNRVCSEARAKELKEAIDRVKNRIYET